LPSAKSPSPNLQVIDERGDGDLVAAAKAGDVDALDTLLRRHYERIHTLCRRMTGSDADAADAAQEALIAIARGLHRFDERSTFATWVYRVATNACLDELRRRKRRPVPAELSGVAVVVGDSADAIAVRLDVDAALARLPTEFRIAVVLRDLSGLSYEEIAGVLDIPPGTVRSRISRGRALLAEQLGNSQPTLERPTP
jgi:RNA polymerase sigma-70 factor (ECF subfamily)